MISCRHIKKEFKLQSVFEDFSYCFKQNGFYLLFGESGCGKTTLLNILSGHISFEAGEICIDGKMYNKQINIEDVEGVIEYITQDANFIEYLTVYDNLLLCALDEAEIDKYLDRFGMLDKKYMNPAKLSGGEKQRVCLIRALLQHKRIILLDEPTAALDIENKTKVFELLRDIKNDALIICSSHDEVALNYADKIIHFDQIEKYNEDICVDTEKVTYTNKEKKSLGMLVKCIGKWFKSPYKEKKSVISLVIVMILAFMTVCLGDVPSNKVDSSIEYLYGINYIDMWISADKLDYVDELYARDDIKEIVLNYGGSVPDGIDASDSDDIIADVDYELGMWVLPKNEENFHMENYLSYGRYIENANEIIVSDAMAALYDNPEELIGQKMTYDMYDGSCEMTIVGIFREPTEVEKQYLRGMGIYIYDDKSLYEDDYAVSGAFTEKYMDDDKFVSSQNQRVYRLFFESYADAKAFYMEVGTRDGIMFSKMAIDLDMEYVFYMMYVYLFPIGLIIMGMAILFYYQTQKTELMYNKKIFAVLQYIGYKIKHVKVIWMTLSVLELVKIFVISGVISYVLMNIVNLVNREWLFISFEIFTYNWNIIFQLFGIVVLVGTVNSMFMFSKLKPSMINRNLVEQRDLL